MAKTSYLNIVNKVLRRVNQNIISDVTSVAGHADIVANLVNEAQNVVYAEDVNWYSLYTTDTFSTVASTDEYTLPSDHGRTLVMINETQDWIMVPDFISVIDSANPNRSEESSPTHFTIQGDNYRLYPTPAAVETIRRRYYKVPTALATNSDVSDLPIEVEPALIEWVFFQMYEYLKQYDRADRSRISYEKYLKKARIANDRIITRMDRFSPDMRYTSLKDVTYPGNYPGRCY